MAFSLTGLLSTVSPAVAKNVTCILALFLAALAYFMYRELFIHNDDSTLYVWQLDRPDITSVTAGYPTIAASSLPTYKLFVANNASGSSFPGTYSHHPHIHIIGEAGSSLILASWSNGLIDEDADGQQVLYSIGSSDGVSWTGPASLFPPALAANQQPQPKAWDRLERALCSEGFLSLHNGNLYAIAELYGRMNVSSLNITDEGEGYHNVGYGRVGIQIDPLTGNKIGNICWIQPSRFVSALINTPYDIHTTPYCPDANDLTNLLSHPSHQPAWSWALLSDSHQVQGFLKQSVIAEPTHAFPFIQQAGQTQPQLCRFWRVLSPPIQTKQQYIECLDMTANMSLSNSWYNGTDETVKGDYGPYSSIRISNMPDANSKAFFGRFHSNTTSSRKTNITHYYISNPKTNGERFPLTIATSANNETLNAIACIATTPNILRYPGLFKNIGYQYPSAAILPSYINTEDQLFVVYSSNKEDIFVTRISVTALPTSSQTGPVSIIHDTSSHHVFANAFILLLVILIFCAVIGYITYKQIRPSRPASMIEEDTSTPAIEIESESTVPEHPTAIDTKDWERQSSHSYTSFSQL